MGLLSMLPPLPATRSVSEEVSDDKKGAKLWDLSMKLVGLA